MSWPDPGGGGVGGGGILGVTGPPHPSTAIYKCRSIRILFKLGELRSVKMVIPFFLGGGGGVRKVAKL